MAKVIMVQGTMSGVGKSLLVAGLCRIFHREGFRAAPFKSQNMALNSFVTREGLEIGRAQAMQAQAAGMEPVSCMNPVLLKPTDHMGSQVIVNGKVYADMSAREYFSHKQELVPHIRKAFRSLEKAADIIVIEGAGSPVEINLKDNDIVNMGLAAMVDAPVLLAGDIDRGGVFAQLLGTMLLLEEEEKKRVKGFIVNKFRGDISLLEPGIAMLEERGEIPVVGVVPYMDVALEDEDSLTERFAQKKQEKIDIAVIRYPRISNFTDFHVFEQIADVSVRYVTSAAELRQPDLVFLPGSKNTIGDLRWMRKNGLEGAVKALAGKVPICGICGGYQMLGERIEDLGHMESGGTIEGMGLLPVVTQLQREKVCLQVKGVAGRMEGEFSALSGLAYEGYEVHMGRTVPAVAESPEEKENPVDDGEQKGQRAFLADGNVYGTYIHGIFDKGGMAPALVQALAEKKGISLGEVGMRDYTAFKEGQYDRLADTLTEYLDMEAIYGMLGETNLR